MSGLLHFTIKKIPRSRSGCLCHEGIHPAPVRVLGRDTKKKLTYSLRSV
ncbi:MAG: hypothetical protein QME51_02785 [Planctomycetota bacterium]|nr:hypothetical protein [Planctomycetota bacterium]